MRDGGELLTDEVSGTTSGDRVEVNVWRGGLLMCADLDVTSWSFDWDADRQVQGQGSLVVADPDGVLAPWGMGDALAPGGSRVQVVWVSGESGVRVALGWWRVRRAEPVEQWRVRTARTVTGTGEVVSVPTAQRVSGGGSVTVRVDELTCVPAQLDRLDAQGQARVGATCLSEVRRLLGDVLPVMVDPEVVDRTVPAALTYDEGRMDAVERLLSHVGAVYRMAGDGVLHVLGEALGAPVWRIDGGEQGALIDVARVLSDDGVYNAVVSRGTSEQGDPLVGRAWLTGGPLEWGASTPFGRRHLIHQSIATTAPGVQADAQTTLATRTAAGQIDLDVTCLTHPGIQVHDAVTVLAATTAGDAPLAGRVVGMRMSSAGPMPAKSMRLVVRVTVEAVEAVATRVTGRRG